MDIDPLIQKVAQALTGKQSHTRNNHINRPVKTARAVLQHCNAAIHITMHNTQRRTVLLLYPYG